mmetsp:Transcript_101456/g.310236  ORF Transcript_101456/g.310236 Transcript_101456/m.310236 type:complete len:249 (-) Transcript_101456:17-763(-)
MGSCGALQRQHRAKSCVWWTTAPSPKETLNRAIPRAACTGDKHLSETRPPPCDLRKVAPCASKVSLNSMSPNAPKRRAKGRDTHMREEDLKALTATAHRTSCGPTGRPGGPWLTRREPGDRMACSSGKRTRVKRRAPPSNTSPTVSPKQSGPMTPEAPSESAQSNCWRDGDSPCARATSALNRPNGQSGAAEIVQHGSPESAPMTFTSSTQPPVGPARRAAAAGATMDAGRSGPAARPPRESVRLRAM